MRSSGDRWRPGRVDDIRPARAAGTRRPAAREIAPPALSHRRVAPAPQPAAVRAPGRGRGGQGHRHAQVRRGVRVALARQAVDARFCGCMGQGLSVRLSGAPLGVRPHSVPQCLAQGRARDGGLPRDAGGFPRRWSGRERAAGGRRRAYLADKVRGGCLRPRHVPRQPPRLQAARHEAQRGCRESWQATSRSSGSIMAGSGSSRWPTAPPASVRCAGRIT